jgi:hypothetical protein
VSCGVCKLQHYFELKIFMAMRINDVLEPAQFVLHHPFFFTFTITTE